MRLVAVLLLAVSASACSGDSATAPTAPTPTRGPLSGVWSGAVSDAINGPGTMRVELTELGIDGSRSLFGGQWTAAFADASKNGAGTIGGVLTATQVNFTAFPAVQGTCPQPSLVSPGQFSIAATATGNDMSGTYLFNTCTSTTSGTIVLRRQ